MRRQAQRQEQQPVAQRDARGVVEGEVGRRPRRAVFGLDEDRREPGRHQQGGRQQAQQLAVSGAEHPCERTHPPGAALRARLVKVAGPERRRGAASDATCMSAPSYPMDDERPPSLWRGMWLRFAIAAVVIVAPERRRDGDRRDEQDQRHRRRSLPEAEPHPRRRQGVVKPPEYERRAADVPGARLRPPRRRRRTPSNAANRTATRSCWCASTPSRGRPRCCRSRAI